MHKIDEHKIMKLKCCDFESVRQSFQVQVCSRLYSVWGRNTNICLYIRVCNPKRSRADGVREVNGCHLVLEVTHSYIVLISQLGNFLILCLSTSCILEF